MVRSFLNYYATLTKINNLNKIQTYLDMINKALTSGRDWDFAINFSGNCYPIKTLYQIETRLHGLKGRNFMDSDGT